MKFRTLLATLASTGSLAAQPASVPPVSIDADASPAAVELPTFEVVGRSDALDLADLRQRFQPTQVRELFAQDAAASLGGGTRNGQRLVLRGIEGSNLNITVDGARQGSNLYNHRGGLANIDADILKQVEVAPGPIAADQGYGALGGAIRYETADAQDLLRDGRTLGARSRLTFASATETWQGSLSAAVRAGEHVGIHAYASHAEFDRLRIGGGFEAPFSAGRDRTRLVKLSLLETGAHSVRLGFERNVADGFNFMQRGDFPYQVQPPVTSRPPQQQTLTRETSSLNWRFDPGSEWFDVRLSVNGNDNDFFAPNSNGERFISRVRGADLRNTASYAVGRIPVRTTAGVEWYRDRGLSRINGRADTRTAVENTGLFLQNRGEAGPVSFSFGARLDDYEALYSSRSTEGDELSVNAGAAWSLPAGLTPFVGYGEATRAFGNMPLQFARNIVATGLLFNGSTTADLRPERSRQLEGGLRFERRGVLAADDFVTASATLFRNRIADFIGFRQPGTGGLGGRPITEFYNEPLETEWRGVDLRVAYARGGFHGSLAYADTKVENPPLAAQFIARITAPTGPKFVGDARYAWADRRFSLGYTLTWVDALTADRVPAGQATYIPRPGYVLHDVQFTWSPRQWSGVTASLAVHNLADKRYSSHATLTERGFATEEAGRDVRLSLAWAF